MPGRVDALDGLRTLAVGAVVVTHAGDRWLPGGQVGVDVFFALSGFLITSLLLREHAASGRIDVKAFLARRALRLIPALVPFLVVGTAIALYYRVPHAWDDLITSATYTTNLYFATQDVRGSVVGHTWSLATEEQFYLLWPLVLGALLGRSGRSPVRAIGLLIVGFTLFSAALQAAGASTVTLYMLPTTRLPELLVGALGAAALHRGLPAPVVRVLRSPVLAAAALVLILAVMRHHTWDDPWSPRGLYTAVAAATTLVILHAVLAPRSPIVRLLALRPLVWTGRRSYGVYLWHLPVMMVAWDLLDRERDVLLFTWFVTLAVAALSWRFVERPFLDRKARFERASLQGDPPAGLAPAPAPSPTGVAPASETLRSATGRSAT